MLISSGPSLLHHAELASHGQDSTQYAAIDAMASADLLRRLELAYSLTCALHEAQRSDLACSVCTDATTAPRGGLCLECIGAHSVVHPGHALVTISTVAPALRSQLRSFALVPVAGCHAATMAKRSAAIARARAGSVVAGSAAPHDPPLVACAKHKAAAVLAELDALDGNELGALDRVAATNADADRAIYETRLAEVRVTAASRRAALQSEAVAADSALEKAIAATGDLAEAASMLTDAEVHALFPALFARGEAARAAVADIPVLPATSATLQFVAPSPTLSDSVGAPVLVSPPPQQRHVHSPHCEHAAGTLALEFLAAILQPADSDRREAAVVVPEGSCDAPESAARFDVVAPALPLLLPGDAPWTLSYGALQKLLSTIHPHVGMTLAAARVLVSMVDDLLTRILDCASDRLLGVGAHLVTARDIQSAVRVILSRDLARHAISGGTASVQLYSRADTTRDDRSTTSSLSGVKWSVPDTARIAARICPGRAFSSHAIVFLAATLEYIAAELLELSGNASRVSRSARIGPRHVLLAVRNDPDLNTLFGNGLFAGGGWVDTGPADRVQAADTTAFEHDDPLFGTLLGCFPALPFPGGAFDDDDLCDFYDTDSDDENERTRTSRRSLGWGDGTREYGAACAVGRAMLALACGRALPDASDAAVLVAADARTRHIPQRMDNSTFLAGACVEVLPRLLDGSLASSIAREGAVKYTRLVEADIALDSTGGPITTVPGQLTLGDVLFKPGEADAIAGLPWMAGGAQADYDEAFDDGGVARASALFVDATSTAASEVASCTASIAAHASGRKRLRELDAAAQTIAKEHGVWRPEPCDADHDVMLENAFAIAHLRYAAADLEAAGADFAADAAAARAAATESAAEMGGFPTEKRARYLAAMERADAAAARAARSSAPYLRGVTEDGGAPHCRVTGRGTLAERLARAIEVLDAQLDPDSGTLNSFGEGGLGALTRARQDLVALARAYTSAAGSGSGGAASTAAGGVSDDEPTPAHLDALLRVYKRVARVYIHSADEESVARARLFFDRLATARIEAAQRGGQVDVAWGLLPAGARGAAVDPGEARALLPLGHMASLVADVAQDFALDVDIEPGAVAALAAAAEDFLVGLFADAGQSASARMTSGRDSLSPADLRFALRLRGGIPGRK